MSDDLPVCGIVMPISACGDQYPLDHWRRVRKIIERAINIANMRPQLVWEKAETDIIQAKILQNIYENDVVVCDVSALNPNVMLEAGLRLSTKKPTVIITDEVVKPPFDISTIAYIPYQHNLEFNATDEFVGKLVARLSEVHKAFLKKTYKSFVENYRFETVTPVTVAVTSEQFVLDRLESVSLSIERLTREVSSLSSQSNSRPPFKNVSGNYFTLQPNKFHSAVEVDAMVSADRHSRFISLNARLSESLADRFKKDVRKTDIATVAVIEKEDDDRYRFLVRIRENETEESISSTRHFLTSVLNSYEQQYLRSMSSEG
ncbi:hypothetical protein [uncultured Sphingomonas sp.]|uniref:hypothetical protein n=1 Tax=uncultured Sphingomonas sp. TaxID=158754 RepID=UPI002600CAD3|nr:hypothetical protein [uncultured Sphingomonas sp.]